MGHDDVDDGGDDDDFDDGDNDGDGACRDDDCSFLFIPLAN